MSFGVRDALQPEGAVEGARPEDRDIDAGGADLLDRRSAPGRVGAHDHGVGVGASQLADLAGDRLVAVLEVGRAGDRAAELFPGLLEAGAIGLAVDERGVAEQERMLDAPCRQE